MEKTEKQDFLSMDRRTFLKVVGAIGASAFLGLHRSQITKALELSKTKIIWLHGAECTGCSASLLDAEDPDLTQALNKLSVDLVFHETLMAHQGIFVDGKPASTSELNSEILLDEAIEEGNYILVVEGAIANGPDGSGKYCMYGERTFKDMFAKAASNANMIMAVGMCAAFGGINTADSDLADLTDFRGVDFVKESHSKGMLTELGIDKPVINIAGCPSHPDWILLTLAAVILGKIDINDLDSVLDKYKRPLVFFPETNTMHDNCPRRGYYDRGILDEDFSGEGCLLKVGCKGPYARSDCGLRKWNGGVSMCTQAGSSCIGCSEPGFPDSTSPFYEMGEDKPLMYGVDIDTAAKVGTAAAAAGVGIHAIRRFVFKDDEE
ncbi:hydrogenase small subunit [Methanolobus profundi]|uniref:Methanophenazine-reducing hydrogenase, small subunit n=1 Tax=Methanolobus profundi TaxID=487685 RepID=A0A1I4PRY5_9EURY|nr:hydrogenase small subunit [Methanolobus profundi]SFM30632.1 methanophenazine-reducing hydrogenase, small subunit [Methanolobus profundi]